MTDQIVEFVHMKPVEIRTEMWDQFAFRKDKKWHWLQRFCLRILKWLGCYAYKFEMHYDRVCVNEATLRENILKQKHLLCFFNKRAVTLLVGQEDFWELLDEVDQRFPETFSVRTTYFQDFKCYGLNVVVIPWMKGMVVLPDNVKYVAK